MYRCHCEEDLSSLLHESNGRRLHHRHQGDEGGGATFRRKDDGGDVFSISVTEVSIISVVMEMSSSLA